MRRLLAITLSCLMLTCILLGCNQPAANPVNQGDKKVVEIDPKIQILPPVNGKGDGEPKDPPIKLIANQADDKQEKYEAALADALTALADRKFEDALVAFEAARTIQDTEFVQSEIAKLKERIGQNDTAKTTVQSIETVLSEGKADEAVKLTNDAIREFGAGDDAPKLIQLRLQADALASVQMNEPNDARYNRYRAEGEAAVGEKNLRAAALAFEQALLARADAELQKVADEIRARLDRYDAQRKKAAELRRDSTQLEDALDALKDAAEAWDTIQVRTETEELMLAMEKRRDNVAIADFEVRNDVGAADAGAAIADEMLPHMKTRFDLVERSQLKRVIDELNLEAGFVDDPAQQKQIAQLAKARYLVVGTIRQIGGIIVQARLVDVRTGLVVQTAKLVAPNMEDALHQAPDLAKQLLMSDEEKMAFEQELQERVAKKVDVVAPDAAIPAAPLPPGADEPAPPAFAFQPAPPALGDVNAKLFDRFEPAPAEVVAPPADMPAPVVQQRLLFATLEMGDNHFRAGRFREAHRQFEFALNLAPNNFEIRLRLQRVLPLLPPPPVVIVAPQRPVFVARPRLAIMPFVNVGNPALIPHSLSYWTPNHLTPYFTSRYDVVDPAEVYWFMGRMGLSLRDVMEDPVARRWLSRVVGVRYFLFGNHIESASFDVNTYLIDAEYGYLVGSARVHVQNRFELKWRLPELASVTLMPPAERNLYYAAQAQRNFDQLVSLGRRHMDQHKYALAVDNFEEALRLRPFVVQVKFYLSQARDKARWQEFELERQRRIAASEAMFAAQRQRQFELAQAAEAARRRAIAEAAARDEAQRRNHLTIRVQAQQNLVAQAQVAFKTKNFGISVNLFQGATNIVPVNIVSPQPPALYQDFAQARIAAERASRAREAELIAVREATLRREREQQLLAAQQQLANERKQAELAQQAQREARLARDEKSFKDSIAQGQRFMTQAKYEAALAAFQGAQRFANSAKERETVNIYLEAIVQRQAEALAKTKNERAEVERKLLVERERRRAAEAAAKQNEENYKLALSLAQQALQEKNYDAAQKKYEEAGKFYKTDIVLAGLRQVDAGRSVLAAQQKKAAAESAKADRVKQFMNDGNAALNAKKYTEAVTAFQQARKLAPDNLEVVTGLTRAEQLRAQLQTEANRQKEETARVQNFRRLLKSGQANLASKQYEAAVASLTEAVKLDPTDTAAQAALKQAQSARDASLTNAKEQAAAKARADSYQKLVNAGQSALSSKRYADAIKAFNDAQKVLPGDKASLDLLQDAQTAKKASEDAIAAAAKQRADDLKKASDLKTALSQGRTALAANDLAKAAKLLNQAKALDPKDADVQRALRDLDQASQRAANEAAAQKKRLQQFQTLLDTGKTALTAKRYPEALKALSNATTLNPENKEAQELFRRAQTESRLAEEGAAKAKLSELISTGLAAIKAKNYDAAEKALRSASLVEPANPAIVQGLKQIESERQAAIADKQRQVDYQLAVGAGQKALQTKNYTAAIQSFQQALKLMPNDIAAQKLLQQALQEQGTLGKAAANFKAAMDSGDKAMVTKNYADAVKAYANATTLNPTDALARQRLAQAQQALNDAGNQAKAAAQFKAAIDAGDKAMTLKNYGDAVKSYTDALKLSPKDAAVQQRLTQSQQALNDAGNQAKAAAQFKAAIDAGDKSMTLKNYGDAVKSYTDALKLSPKDAAVQQRLTQAQQALNDAGNQAKAAAQFKGAIDAGDKAMALKNYGAAVKSYTEATKLNPTDALARQRLAQAQQALNDANNQAKAADQFKAVMDAGDKAMALKNYGAAVKSYTEATKLSPTDAVARQRLAQAQQALNDASQQAANQANYQKAISAGQSALKLKNYPEAVKSFQAALKWIPNDKGATQLLQEAQQQWNASKIKAPPPMPPVDATKQAFDAAMKNGASLEKQGKYGEAMKAYQEALKARPKDAEALAGMKNNQFNNHLAIGQSHLNNAQWAAAQREFETALRIFPTNDNAKKLLEKAKKKTK
jgi:tetratricopeptide (TPR) repeat protein